MQQLLIIALEIIVRITCGDVEHNVEKVDILICKYYNHV